MALSLVFAATTLIGAFLLFQIQPLLSKAILPVYGGGPAVWTTCLLFFQSLLFAGYAYAHLSERRLPRIARLIVHLGLIGAALWFLPKPPDERVQPEESANPTWPILLILAVQIGVPYFLLSSTGPLTQAWFSRVMPGRSPYRLYALSNLGSLAALLTYPFVVEPLWGLRMQLTVWRWAFVAYAALSAAGAIAAARAAPEAEAAGDEEPPPTAGMKALWVLLPAFGSAMLLAVTQQLGHEVAVIPFLWILPLAAYLLSFILAFDHPRWFLPAPTAAGTLLLAFGAAISHGFRTAYPLRTTVGIGLNVGALFGACMLCHGVLARLKPEARHLTSYYLSLSGGGALGSLFVSLVAPALFTTLVEWKAGMAMTYVGAWLVLAWICRGGLRAHLNAAAALLVVSGIGLAFLLACFVTYSPQLEVVRNFYGVVGVEEAGGKDGWRNLMNGRILHGRQFLGGELRKKPSTYYVEGSGIGLAMARLRSRDDFRIGVVGLGSGTMAVYGSLASQTIRFYEINPEVKRLAETWFSYLKDCPAKVEVVPGDARVSMEREAPRRYDVLVVDAFTGDTIPTHLLTLEAMEVYRKHLIPEGVLALHISNRSVSLAPVVRGAAHRLGMKTVEVNYEPGKDDRGGASSLWMLCTSSEAAYRDLSPHATPSADAREFVWTDDFSDMFSILRLR